MDTPTPPLLIALTIVFFMAASVIAATILGRMHGYRRAQEEFRKEQRDREEEKKKPPEVIVTKYLGGMIESTRSNGAVKIGLSEYGTRRLEDQRTVEDIYNLFITINDLHTVEVKYNFNDLLASDAVEFMAYKHLTHICFLRLNDILSSEGIEGILGKVSDN
jgi:hypothetical protein